MCVPHPGRDLSLRVLCISLLKKHFAKPFRHPQHGAALGLLLRCAWLRAWDGSAASHIPAGKGRCLRGAGKRDSGAGEPLPPRKGQRCSGHWAKRGWREVWLLQELSRGAAAKPGLILGLVLQSCPRGSSAAELQGSQRPCAGADPAALLMALGSPASCVTGPGRVGAGGLWSSSSSQHLGDGGWGTWQPEGPSLGMVVGCFPLAWCDDGVVARADPGCGGLLHHGLCLEEHGVFGFPGSLPLSCGGSRRLNG